MPAFVFQITEVREHENVLPGVDSNGHWLPSHIPGYNVIARVGATGVWFVCNGEAIWTAAHTDLPRMEHYKTFSVFFCGGFGFRVLEGNATSPASGKTWRPLGFEYDPNDGHSSFLTNVLQETTLKYRREDQGWVNVLLPNTYHGSKTRNPDKGALKGELPIFLALLALSMPLQYLQAYIPQMMQNGAWTWHKLGSGWDDKRGVIVTVYSVPGWAGGGAADIQAYEDGRTGKYYY
ncbi:hypothetical protein E8E12_008599 [Didymella heteroderae]|uniref:Uncharacterized protein n=1 Tax=Didymella heteroderae TaxID=1769908 RepID=A0A9P4WQL0_9PLEO|nr:hypothetical protein E8E12_008599 [Didymella heteroderae]